MAIFAYKGRNGRGDLVEGTLDGDDSGIIANQLMNTGITPVEIIQFRGVLGGASGKPGWVKRLLTEQPVTPLDLMLFSRQMYTLLKAGVPIMRALAGLQESTQNATFSALLQDLRESLDSGRELSAALRRHPRVFSPFYVSMVQVGEMTGMLDTTFIRLYEHLEFERDMRERIKAAMRYPSFVIMA
ncbi:MAG TPA: type II secretion system F family protein, partial [Gallionella sp.]|nr:type II secretion system F family protein [Gallionella sp.]